MARAGIYVGGKEIVARYVGNTKVWEKEARWTLVKGFSTSGFTFVADASSLYRAKVNKEQFMYNSPPRVLENERFPDIANAKIGQYKVKFPYLQSWSDVKNEIILLDIRITNIQRRHKNNLSMELIFHTTEDRNRFVSWTQSGQFVELYRKE